MPKLEANVIKTLSEKELLKILEDEVFNDSDFKRHIKETAIKENVSYKVVETTIKHYFISIGLEMIKIQKKPRRITLFGFMNIDIVEPKNNKFSIYFKTKKNESKQ